MTPEPSPHHDVAVRTRLAAHWLALGQGIDAASLAFTVLAAAALLWLEAAPAVRLALVAVVLAGLAEKFFALRVAFDRAIFSDWARRWEKTDAISAANDLAAFDAALAAVGRCRGDPGGRCVEGRIRGAMKLLRRQAGLFIIQAAAILAAVICRYPSWLSNV